MYICTYCGSIEKTESDVLCDPQTLDTGTTFACAQCGKDTVVVLMRPEEYREFLSPRDTATCLLCGKGKLINGVCSFCEQ